MPGHYGKGMKKKTKKKIGLMPKKKKSMAKNKKNSRGRMY